MSALLANQAIVLALAGLIGTVAALVAAAANWLNARTRQIEVGLQLADQQRQITHLAAVQVAQQVAPPAPAPIIITPPAAAPSSAAGTPAPEGPYAG